MTAVVEEARSVGGDGNGNESGDGEAAELEEGYIYNDDVFARRFDLNRLKDIVRQHRQAKESSKM